MLSNNLYNSEILYDKKSIFEKGETKIFGFWIYLMSDCVLFSILFAIYIVLKNSIADGPSGIDIFDISYVLVETIFLLFSSISYGISMLGINDENKNWLIFWLSVTFFFGLIFIIMEFKEFFNLIENNHSPNSSAFLSSFFTLVGIHGIHVIAGLIWIQIMILIILYRGVTLINKIRLQCLSLFWHFIDLIWIFVFTIVYLMGVLLP